MVNELVRIRDYDEKNHHFCFWRERDHEIDIVVLLGGDPVLAIECKSGQVDISPPTVKRFRDRFPGVKLVVASLTDARARKINDIDVLPWHKVLQLYKRL